MAATSRSIQTSLLVLWLLHLATAEKTCNGCTAGVGLLQKSPRQHVMVVPGVPYDWYPVDGGDGRACRGATSHDNQASYYSVVSGIPSIDLCKDECLKHSNCSGIEFSGTRCEVWTRPEGIQASIPLENFQCWSYQPSLFEAVDGGLDRRCEGTSDLDVVQQGIQTISQCKLQCVTTPACKGVEFEGVGGTCKLLTRPDAIASSTAAPGYSCYRLEFYQADPLVAEAACRGAHVNDNQAAYFKVMENTGSIDECKQSCREEAACQGIEFAGTHCEVWVRPEGIEAVKPLSNSKCLKYSAGTVPSTTATTESTTATTMTTTESTTTTTVLTMASTTESVTTTEATTTSAKECRKGYDQCGGKGYTGNTCCIYGWDCIVQNEFYSQCRPTTGTTTTVPLDCTAPGTEFAPRYRQCGGRNWNGPRCCENGDICVFDNEYYSGCKPPNSTTTAGSTTSTQQTTQSSAVSSTSTTTTTPVATTTVATTTTTVATTTATTTTTVATTTPASTTAATTPSTTVGTTTTTASTTSGVTTATTTASVECKKRYEKCGGMNYDGATCCEPGWWCVYGGPYYSQCKTTTTTTPYVSASPELQKDAQFLIQSTFGPTRASLADLGTKSHEDWLQEQLQLEPSLHRSFYRQRVKAPAALVENTVEAPASSKTWTGGECPSVPRTFLNEDGCELLPGCAPLQLQSVDIQLNVSVLQKFFEVEGRYVYAVTDLLPTTAPCGVPSRWKLLDCSEPSACAATESVDAADAAAISAVLVGGTGSLRDITVACGAATPSGVVVEVVWARLLRPSESSCSRPSPSQPPGITIFSQAPRFTVPNHASPQTNFAMYFSRAAHLVLLFEQIYAMQPKPRTFLHKTVYDANAIEQLANQLPPGVTKDLFQSFSLCGTCKAFKRFGEEHDGGYLHYMDSLQPSTLRAAYSMGVEQHDQWSLDVFNAFNIPIFQYDCTVSTPAQVCEKCQFFPACMASKELNKFPGKTTWTLKEAIDQSKMSDAPDRSLLMKMDIEFGEWSTLTDSDMAILKKFRQLVIEFHGLEHEQNHKTYLQTMQALQHAGFKVAHVHGNNFASTYVKEDFKIPMVVEVTLDASVAMLPKCRDPNYEELDRPNNVAGPEIRDIHTEPTERE